MSESTVVSECVNYNFDLILIINSSNYTNNPINFTNPPILTVTISLPGFPLPGTNIKASIMIGTIVNYTLDIDPNNNNNGTMSTTSENTSFAWPRGSSGTYVRNVNGTNYTIPNATIFSITLTGSNSSYIKDDKYVIDLLSCIDETAGTIGANVAFTRQNNISIDDNICDSIKDLCTSSCKTVRIPAICILGQSMSNGSDISDMTFTIFDECDYYDEKCIVDKHQNRCCMSRLECSKLKETIFIKCCPWIVSVTKGKGNTLKEKLLYLIENNLQPDNIGITDFLSKIIKYAMTRYILSRILYGNFNINYLLEKYFKKFIKDLGKSRFCRFIDFFEDCSDPDNNFVGYEKYFLCDKKCDMK